MNSSNFNSNNLNNLNTCHTMSINLITSTITTKQLLIPITVISLSILMLCMVSTSILLDKLLPLHQLPPLIIISNSLNNNSSNSSNNSNSLFITINSHLPFQLLLLSIPNPSIITKVSILFNQINNCKYLFSNKPNHNNPTNLMSVILNFTEISVSNPTTLNQPNHQSSWHEKANEVKSYW